MGLSKKSKVLINFLESDELKGHRERHAQGEG